MTGVTSGTPVYFGEAAAAYAQGLADGAAAERERIRQLAAEQADIADSQALTPDALIPAIVLRKFADLIAGDSP